MRAQILFDRNYYGNSFEHFMSEGWKKGRNPHPLFDVRFYAASAGLDRATNPLLHYLASGPLQKLSPHPLFDIMLYWKSVPPWSRSETPLEYYLQTGWKKGVNVCPFFDPEFYSRQVSGLPRDANPLIHFLTRGWKRAFSPSRYFDTNYYLRQFPDLLRKEINPLKHFVTVGAHLNARPHPLLNQDLFFSLQQVPDQILHVSDSRKKNRSSKRGSLPETLIFLHIPKTAGTSVRNWLNWNIPHGRLLGVFPEGARFEKLDLELPQVLRHFGPDLDAIAGHYYYGIHQQLTCEAKYFTFLRDPVQRLVSWYRNAALRPKLPYHREIRAGMTLEEFLLAPKQAAKENLMTRMIAGAPERSHPRENDPLLLEMALENIRKDFCFVGTVNRLDAGIRHLERAFGFPDSRIPHLNPGTFEVKKPSRKAIRLIRDINEQDFKLYARFEKRIHAKF